MKDKTNCPPLTMDEIIALKGEPAAKRIELVHNSSLVERWVYYQANTKKTELFLFKDGKLSGWTTKLV
jgi:hypothetical protein